MKRRISSAIDRSTGHVVALKKIDNILEHRTVTKRTLREIMFLRIFSGHENVRETCGEEAGSFPQKEAIEIVHVQCVIFCLLAMMMTRRCGRQIVQISRIMRPLSRRFTNLYVVTELMEADLDCIVRICLFT
jgi:hypothetical protein